MNDSVTLLLFLNIVAIFICLIYGAQTKLDKLIEENKKKYKEK